MADEETGLEEVLADIKFEGEPDTPEEKEEEKEEKKEEKAEKKDEEKETPTDSPTEETKTEEPPASEGGEEEKPQENIQSEVKPPPFNEHPRWRQLQQRSEEREEAYQELQEKQIELERQLKEKQQSQEPMPNWFQEQFGDNPQVWQGFRDYNQVQREQLKAEILQEQQAVTQQQVEQAKYWENWVEDSIMTVEQEQGIDLSQGQERNAYLKFMGDYRPTDDQGNLDFKRGWDLYSQTKSQPKQNVAEKKEVAAATMDEGKGQPKKKDYLTPNDLKGTGWDEELDNI